MSVAFLRFLACVFFACFFTVFATVSADDTETFFTQPLAYPPYVQTGDIAPPNPNYPNILFILDASESMKGFDGTGKSRLQRLQDAMEVILNQASRVNIGVMRFSHLNSGGRIIYPMSPIEFAREDAMAVINAMSIDWFTPTVGAILEAAYYWSGLPVYYGTTRALESHANHVRVHQSRVSHPESYTGGQVYRDENCTDADLNHPSCESERIEGGPVYSTPLLNECQGNFQVVISDGGATGGVNEEHVKALTGKDCTGSDANKCGSDLAEYMDTTALAGLGTVATYTVGFNANVAALSDIATAGGGRYFRSSSASELAEDLSSIVKFAVEGSQSFTAPAITVDQATKFSHRDDMYLALFEPENKARWAGNLKRYRFDGSVKDVNDDDALDSDTGIFKSTSKSWWSVSADGASVASGGAAGVIPATDRKVYTYTGGSTKDLTFLVNKVWELNPEITASMLDVSDGERENLLKWARGVDTDGDGDMRLEMGGALHARPTVVNYDFNEDGYNSVVFVGTNDGYLHAINSQDGVEVFSFIPPELLQNLSELYKNDYTNATIYGLDGDLTLWTNDTDGTITAGDDHAYLYMGMRRGGSNYTALDVTIKATPKFMWSINGGDIGFENLGQTWSKPTLGKINHGGEITKVLIFGGGYDPLQDITSIKSADTVGNSMYIVNAETGALIWSVSGDTTGYAAMEYSIPSDPAVLDINGDGLTDQIYVGDMGGQVWRFDINDSLSTGAVISGGVIADFSGTEKANNRRFFNRPDVAYIADGGKSYLSVSIGSGNRAHPLETFGIDRFYMIRQYDIAHRPVGYGIKDTVKSTDDVTVYRPLKEDDLYDTTENLFGSTDLSIAADAVNDLSEKDGWYITLSLGEKVLAASLTANHQIFFTTYLPQASVNPCSAVLGQGRTYAVNLLNGTPTSGLAKEDRYTLIETPGIPPEPVPHVSESGELSIIVGTETVNTSTPELVKRVFWTEPPNY